MAIVDDDELSARLRKLPNDIEVKWPEAIRLSLAFGKAVRVEAPVSKRTEKRSCAAVERLGREPAFQEEARRIFTLAGDFQPFPTGGTKDEIRAWDKCIERRYAIIKGEAARFAATHRFPYISPPGVVAVFLRLLSSLRRDADGRPPPTARIRYLHDAPVFYVNPLTDTELSAPVEPGHILVDLTHASTEDLKALAKPLAELQARVGYRKPSGGREFDDREERCRTFQRELPSAIYRARDAREERGDPRHGDLRQHELATAFGWHEDTLKARLHDCGIDWAKTKRRVGSRIVGAGSH